MKKISFYIIFTLIVLAAYPQTINIEKAEYDKMVSEQNELVGRVAELTDSLRSLSGGIKDLTKQLQTCKTDLMKAEICMQGLKKSKVKNERDNLRNRVAVLGDSIVVLNRKIEAIEELRRVSADQRYSAGKAEIARQISERYNADFDALVVSYTLAAVERDTQFVSEPAQKQKMQQLLTYFRAKELLNAKYDEKKVTAAMQKLSKVPETPSVKSLKGSLDYYKSCSKALRTTLSEIDAGIVEIENKFSKDVADKQKFRMMIARISLFIWNQEFSLYEYPYLGGIVVEILNNKNPSREFIANLSQKLPQ